MKGFAWLLLLSGAVTQAAAQQALSLDSCRALALGNNKQLAISELQADVAANAILDACTGSNPRQPSQEEMEKLLECVYNDVDVDF